MAPDGVFHVWIKGVDGCPIFRDGCDRLAFLSLLRDAVECGTGSARTVRVAVDVDPACGAPPPGRRRGRPRRGSTNIRSPGKLRLEWLPTS